MNTVKHKSPITISTKQREYQVTRITDEQYYELNQHALHIFPNYDQLMKLSVNEKYIFCQLSKMYVTLEFIFGDSGQYFDEWKGAFAQRYSIWVL